ncbi:MAG: VOC family protein [Acidimicrobiia bacterium]
MAPRTDHLRHQAMCVTDDEVAVGAALAVVLGLPAGTGDLSWEAGSPALISNLLGPDSAGMIELMPLPPELGGRLVPGTTSISFAVDDLDERVAACRAAGLDVTVGVGSGDLSYAVVVAAGLEFELVRFGA